MKKKIKKKDEAPNPEQSQNDKSEEYQNFIQGLKRDIQPYAGTGKPNKGKSHPARPRRGKREQLKLFEPQK